MPYPMKAKLKNKESKEKQTKVCCSKIDVKNEGYVLVKNIKVWEYHCYTCDKTWTEKEEYLLGKSDECN